MTTGQRQELFMRLLPRLIDKAHEMGFHIRGGDLFRDPRAFGNLGEQGPYGNKNSEHKNKCAIDLNLRHPERGMLWKTEDHRELGEWWEEQHEYCRWGGRYNDGNHYEVLPWR